MRMSFVFIGCLTISLGLAGCRGNPDNLLFVDTNIYGASVGPGGTAGSVMQLGYASVSYFDVPVTRLNTGTGVYHVLEATKPSDGRDAFSAFASFGSTVGGSTSCIGRVAAVGHAARIIAASTAKQC